MNSNINAMEKYRTSPLWSKYRKEFKVDLWRRSYGENLDTDNSKIFRSLHLYKLFDNLFFKFTNFQLRFYRYFLKRILGRNRSSSYGLYLYKTKFSEFNNLSDECKRYIEIMHNRIGLKFSYASYKSAYFLYKLSKILHLPNSGNIIEIGSGGVQFSRMLVSEMSSFSLVLVDLPEVILFAKELLLKSKLEARIYGPEEVGEFLKCSESKKVLFLEPDQLENIQLEFDLAINIESFGEMYQDVANNYIDILSSKLRKRGSLFLINRISRCVNLNEPYSLNSHTQFCKYPLDSFETICLEVDDFKIVVSPEDKEKLNYFYLGKRK